MIHIEKDLKGMDENNEDPNQALYEDNIEVRNEFLKAFNVKLGLDDMISNILVDVAGWD